MGNHPIGPGFSFWGGWGGHSTEEVSPPLRMSVPPPYLDPVPTLLKFFFAVRATLLFKSILLYYFWVGSLQKLLQILQGLRMAQAAMTKKIKLQFCFFFNISSSFAKILGKFPEVGQKQKTGKRERKLVLSMASYALQRHLGSRKAAWAKISLVFDKI